MSATRSKCGWILISRTDKITSYDEIRLIEKRERGNEEYNYLSIMPRMFKEFSKLGRLRTLPDDHSMLTHDYISQPVMPDTSMFVSRPRHDDQNTRDGWETGADAAGVSGWDVVADNAGNGGEVTVSDSNATADKTGNAAVVDDNAWGGSGGESRVYDNGGGGGGDSGVGGSAGSGTDWTTSATTNGGW